MCVRVHAGVFATHHPVCEPQGQDVGHHHCQPCPCDVMGNNKVGRCSHGISHHQPPTQGSNMRGKEETASMRRGGIGWAGGRTDRACVLVCAC